MIKLADILVITVLVAIMTIGFLYSVSYGASIATKLVTTISAKQKY